MRSNRVRMIFTRENGRRVAGGGPRRPAIRYFLGKDWWESWTAVGLIVWTGARSAVESVCGAGLVPQEWCVPMLQYLTMAGQILTILGVRRGGRQ